MTYQYISIDHGEKWINKVIEFIFYYENIKFGLWLHFPIDVAPNKIPFGAKSIGKL